MVKKKANIKAEVIILGCSLPGIVTAHKLKKRFGKSMDIVVLDLSTQKAISKGNVAFQADDLDESETSDDESSREPSLISVVDTTARDYLLTFAREFRLPLPDIIAHPVLVRSRLNKLFQYPDGSTVQCTTNYHEFDYLNIMEKFELNQYQNLLDQNARDLFQPRQVSGETGGTNLLYFDKTTMEQHICSFLFFSTSREVMRMTVRLVCGAPSHLVSVLFYLHQCYRTSSVRNHLDGNNTRFREKLLGYCRRHFSNNLQKSVADITVAVKPIQKIRSYANEQVILETIKGETNYICNLLAMALKPDELLEIAVEEQFLSNKEASALVAMRPGKVIKFRIQYEQNFWKKQGYSGDILSIRGPIVWATERPNLSSAGGTEKFAGLIGYLILKEGDCNSKDAVLEQLTKLFGEEAATPVAYNEKDISDVFVPLCGDYVAVRNLTSTIKPYNVEWSAMDVFNDGDVAAALEAGHNAYLHLLTSLRPQAITFEDLELNTAPTILDDRPLARWLPVINYRASAKLVVCAAVLIIGIKLFRTYMQK